MTLQRSIKELRGFGIGATDGDLGKIVDVYFDDERWTIRYLVADVGGWLTGRKVLISPHAVVRIDPSRETVETRLTRAEVEKSPPIETDLPISRRMEADYNRYYRYPPYWGGHTTGLWGIGALPLAGLDPVLRGDSAWRQEAPPITDESEVHLRSTREVTGYHVAATDGGIGHVDDFLFAEHSWAVRHLVVDTRDWWPGRHVLVSPEHIERVSWPERTVHLDLARAAVEQSPEYDPRRASQSTIANRM